MQYHRIFLICFACSFLINCGKKTTETTSGEGLLTVRPGVTLRESPGLEGKILAELPDKTPLEDLGAVSEYLTHLEWKGQILDEPWIKVSNPDYPEAWVFAGEVAPAGADSLATAVFRQDKRLKALLGPELNQKLESYNQAFESIASAGDFADAYRLGVILQDSLARPLERKLDPLALPNLDWFNTRVRAYNILLVAEGTAYYFFNDYKQWLEAAQKTPQPEDEAFTHLMIACFPEDSIEFFYPVWYLQTWDYGGESLLGRGHHFRILQQADQLYKAAPTFHQELNILKQQIIDDICNAEVSYWETTENIQKELDEMLTYNWKILSANEVGMLRIRREQFDEPDKFEIRVNTRSGSE